MAFCVDNLRMIHESVIGRPYYWRGKDGRWRCKHRGHVFWVPSPGLSKEALDELAGKAEQAMLQRNLDDARRGAR